MTEYRPDFFITPGVIAYDDDIPYAGERLYAIIYWFSKLSQGKCVASNDHLARLMGKNTTERYVGMLLQGLEDKGYIKRLYQDDSQRHRTEIVPLVYYNGSVIEETFLSDGRNDARQTEEKILQISNKISKSNKYSTQTEQKATTTPGQLPGGGSTPLARVSNAYRRLYRDAFDLEPRLYLAGKDGAVLKSLLKDYTEYQVAAILAEYFDCQDEQVKDAAYPISWIMARVNQLTASLNKDLDFNNPAEIKKVVDETYIDLKDLSDNH